MVGLSSDTVQLPMTTSPRKRPGKPDGPRAQNREKRSQSLMDSALERFLEHGIDAVRIDDITQGAGVAKGSYYRYFSGKSALVDALFEDMRRDLETYFNACEESLSKATNASELVPAYLVFAGQLVEFAGAHRDEIRLYLQESRAPASENRGAVDAISEFVAKKSARMTEIAAKHGLLGAIPPQVSALAVVGAVERLMLAWLRDELGVPKEEVGGALITIVLDGVTPKGT